MPFLGQNWPFLVKDPNFQGREQKFWYPLIGKPPRHLVRIVFLSGMGPNGPNLEVFGPKIQFLGWREQNFWYLRILEPMRKIFRVKNIDKRGPNRPLGTKMCKFDPKIWIFGVKSQNSRLQFPKHINGDRRLLGYGMNWRRSCHFSEKKNGQHEMAKNQFIADKTLIFSLSPLFFCKKRFLILRTLPSNVGNMVCAKIGPYPKSALTGGCWPKIRFFA